MPHETDRKMVEILRILSDSERTLGASTIAEELKKKGYDLGERAVRYHMRILDERGFTERIGYAGRKITDKGLRELEKALMYDRVDFVFSKFEEKIYQTTLDPIKREGMVVVNMSNFAYEREIMDIIKKVFKKGIAVSPYVKIAKLDGKMGLNTICGTTIDGILLKDGIPVIPKYGGILKVEDNVPTKFTELIAYKKTSMNPLEAFTAKEMTSVLQVIEKGSGAIPANFRVIPSAAKNQAEDLFERLRKIGISGIIRVGESGESVLGIPVEDDMVGIAIIGGIAPLCAAQEAGYSIDIKSAENIMEFKDLEKIVASKPILKATGHETKKKVEFLLSKAWNLIYKVDLDLKFQKGNVVANISYVNNEDLDDALEIMSRVCGSKYCTSRFFKIIPHGDSDKSGIVTICSLTIDGILIKNGILAVPRYGGILEIGEKESRFIELTAYSGSSLDPHEIFLAKGMTSVLDAIEGSGRILASLREIPYLARTDAIDILGEIEDAGVSILKVGKPSELVYNAKVERYHVGIVTPGGLNQIAAIKEQGIHVDAKAVETVMDISEMDEF